MSLSWDWETRSRINLRTQGAYIYAKHPSTDALLASYRLKAPNYMALSKVPAPIEAWLRAGGFLNEMYRWFRGQPCPRWVRAYVEAGGDVTAFNASFERVIWQGIMTPRHDWPTIDITQFRCTMAQASALGLPRGLDKLSEALDLPVKKDKIGKSLIRFFSVPRADGLFNEPEDHSEKFQQFSDYCCDDVEAECGAAERMIPLSDAEQEIYVLSERINSRGVRIDRRSALAAIALVEKAKLQLDEEMTEVTGRAVTTCSQVAKLTAWAATQGVPLDGVAKNDIVDALDLHDLPDKVRSALLLRQEAAKSSTAKLKSFIAHADPADDIVRGVFVYHATGPGRWSSAGGVNLGNMPRPRAIYDGAELDMAALFSAFRTEDPNFVRALYGEKLGRPLDLVSDAIRGFLWAAPGSEFLAVDYSGIQGAIGAWLSGEEWKLAAMREITANPLLPDMYRRAAAGILNTTTEIITKKHPMRQAVGKTSELSMLFSGGVVALAKMAKNYGMRLRDFHDLYPAIAAAASEEIREKVAKRYERTLKSRDKVMSNIMSREAWMACDMIKFGWRATNPAAARGWDILEDATIEAVRNPGKKIDALKVSYLFARGALWCRLMSGRCICYNAPRLRDQVWAKLKLEDGSWTEESEVCDREEAQKLEMRGLAKIEGNTRQKLTAIGVDPQTQKMVRYGLYGGLYMQNLCLGIESDILRIGMRKLEAAGYEIRTHNYDEIVAELPRGVGSVDVMTKMMLNLPPEYATLPLGAHGWAGKRYRHA